MLRQIRLQLEAGDGTFQAGHKARQLGYRNVGKPSASRGLLGNLQYFCHGMRHFTRHIGLHLGGC